ncbi:hypothetical protein L1049_021246 [Liquidambar formosana]|uniref:Two-component response regulator-like APRR5 n=1 Tax=Liquidambar formosana TaxID=63359 RepID=A0AAP0SE77_LIQFO
MGEVVVSSSEEDLKMECEMETRKDDGCSGGVVMWERFLSRMALRVLLVEADDSTRQIIAALLRKCNYKVAAVPDGLKAWEVLKGRPNEIDLILTEVELPSICGFSLLTLIMEHDVCKNIPVIMMSKYDTVSMVYKCMLRGAADFLVKPIRRNELKNLWQHVWRRQSSTGGRHGPQDGSVAQQKVEATSENNPASNHSSGYMACIPRNEECIEKGSDAQSSCTKPDLEAESAYMENLHDLSQPEWSKTLVSDMKAQKNEECVELGQRLVIRESEARGSAMSASQDANTMTQCEEVEPENQREDANFTSEACDNNDVFVNSAREAIDLIGAFNNNPKWSYRNSCSDNGTNKFDSSPHLDLSLRRFHPSGFENQVTDERQALNHSNASAFSRYINRPLQPLHPSSTSVCNQQKKDGTNSDKHLSSLLPGYNFDTTCPTLSTQRSVISLATGQSGEAETALPCTQQRVFPAPVPVRGIRFDSLCTGYGLPPIFCTQSGPSPIPSSSSAGQKETSFRANPFHQSHLEMNNSQQLYDSLDQNANNSTNQTTHKQEYKLDSLDDRGRVSPATDRSANSSFCNGAVSHLNSIGCGSMCGSNGNVNAVAVVRSAEESKNEGPFNHEGNSHRSIQREVALNKFRLKRKDRCFEKKVRYESRKKLAEQRPRVKGQFVRQVHTDPSSAENDNYCGNSFDG